MNGKTTLIILIYIFPLNLLFSQSELYFWGYRTKYELTADSLESVLIPKVEDFRLNNTKVAYESFSPITNRKEILLKLNHSSFLESQASNEFDILPVFRHGDFPLIPTGEIVFKPRQNIDYNRIQEFCDNTITFLRRSKYGTFTIKPKELKDLLKVSNKIYESGLVEWCEPNFIIEIVKYQVTPTDPLYPQQYYLNQGNDIDIDAPEAWELSRGVNEVRVAVIDDGVENHEDLNGRVLSGFTPLDPNGQGAPTNNLPPETEVIIGHGQACAGIIGATHDNNGISGIAPCSQIVPVNIFNSWTLDFNFPEGQRLIWLETPEDIAEAINWAWDEGGAEVLSNSWGYGTTNANNIPDSGQIIQAIENARDDGRGGLGSIVVFASGNFHQAFNGVTFPANVDGVVTVGAINGNGNIWNYSSRGSEMNLVAPSGNTGGNGNVTTTDRMGVNGYDSANYTDDFGGTSAAAPQVSGVAALMLSINPSLTEQQVVNILNNTATDMGASGFDNTFGHGRLNAESAVRQSLLSISGSDNFCGVNSINLTLPLVAGFQYNWSVDTKLHIVSGQNTNSVVVEPVTGKFGIGKVTLTINGNCGNLNLNKDLQISPVVTNFRYTGNNPGNPMTGEPLEAEVDPVPNANFYEWYSDSNLLETTTVPYISTYNWECGDHRLYVRASTSCGYTDLNGPDNYYWGLCLYSYSYSPNPASSEITIVSTSYTKSKQSFNSLSKTNLKGSIVLYDFNGSVVQTEEYDLNSQSFKLDVSQLKPGKYFMKIGAAREEEIHQIVIRR